MAVYELLGIRPFEHELDISKLGLFASVLFDEASLEYEIAQRQLAVKDISSDSCFMQCKCTLTQIRFFYFASLQLLLA